MKSNPASDHVYFNDGFKCSSISITTNLNESIGDGNGADSGNGSQGSNEFILTDDGKKIIPPTKPMSCAKSWLQERSRKTFKKKILHKRIPILRWLPKYNSEDALGDLVAGITVGLTVIPQALAYSGIAGLPAAYGLYGSFLGCFVYIFLGSCKDVPVGPSAIVALLTFQVAQGSWQKSVLLCLLSGVVELLMGLFGLGFLIDFVSGPVSSGFTSAVSLIILTSQVKNILGIAAKGTTFVEIWTEIIHNIKDVRASDTILGITCIVVLLIMRLLPNCKIGPKEPHLRSKVQNVINKIIWIVGTSRNAILVILCCVMGVLLHSYHEGTPFKVIGYIPQGLPTFALPPTHLNVNETLSGKEESFVDMVRSMGSGLIVIPLISLMENIAICKAFANGKPVDASQELIAIGAANIANSFVQGFPGTGALSRGAVNNASGVRTPLSNIYSGALVIISLIFFTPYFYYIPNATLAAIIIAAVVFMVEVKVVKPMWRAKKSDLLPGLVTFIACLVLPLEMGILIGVGLNVIFILYSAARPKLSTDILTSPGGTEYLMITPDRCIIFPSVDYVRNLVNKQSMRNNIPVVIDASHIYGADFTAATVIDSLLRDFATRQQLIFFYNLKPSICALFESLSPAEFVVYYQEQQLDELLKERDYTQDKLESYGLYGSFLGCFVYIFLGSCKDVPVGPSAIVALLTFQVAQGSWQKSVLLCLLSGVVELLMGLFGLGFLIDFVSGPVSSGFTSAVSLIILTSQVKNILGIAAKGTTFVEIWTEIIHNIKDVRASDTILGITCIVVLLIMRLLPNCKIGPKEPHLRSKVQNVINKIIWIVGTSRNAILVILCCVMGVLLHSYHEGTPFKVIGYIPQGLPTFALPPTHLNVNETLSGKEESFVDMVRSMGSGLIVIPLISLMENIAICKAFANGKPVDASQELIAIGAANIANSFVQGFPGTGALSRGAVNNASGVRTPLSNIYSGALVIISLIFFTPYFYYIPNATLAAIIIAAVVFMVEVKVVKPMWRAKKSDLLPGLVTFIACLVLPLEMGILIGVGLNVIFILYSAARPKLSTDILTSPGGTEYLMITPDRCIIFPSVDYVRNLVNKQSMRNNIPVVIDASHIYGADFTAATVIDSLLRDFATRQQLIFFYNLKPSICALFESLSPAEFVVYYQEQQLDELLKERDYTQDKLESVGV